MDLRALLEAAVRGRCTLTPGDEVWVRSSSEKEYPLLVVEVQPDDAGAVSLIETDVEVDIAPSQDYEEAMRRLAAAEAARLEAAARAARDADEKRREAEAAAEEAATAEEETARAAARDAARAERYRAALASALPPEPDVDLPGCVPCRFTLPDGSTRSRRFAATDPLAAVFDFVRSVGGAGEGERFRLVTRWPRTVIEAPEEGSPRGERGGEGGVGDLTVAGGGLRPSDAFFVERKSSAEE